MDWTAIEVLTSVLGWREGGEAYQFCMYSIHKDNNYGDAYALS